MGALCESVKANKRASNSLNSQFPNAPKSADENNINEANTQLQVQNKEDNRLRVKSVSTPIINGDVMATNNKFNKIKSNNNENCNIRNKENLNIIRKIGEVKGEQVIIAYCKNSSIIILDYSAQVTIEGCDNCNIFIAPCASR